MELRTKPKVFTVSTANGCLTNLMETTSIRKALRTEHYENTQDIDHSDVIIVNTCGYNTEAEDSSMSAILDYQKKYPTKKVIVTGCLPRINKERLKKDFTGPVVSTGELEKLNQVLPLPLTQIQSMKEEASRIDDSDLATRLPSNRWTERLSPVFFQTHRKLGLPNRKLVNILDSVVFDRQTFALSVSKGCLGKCTYCAIKKAKGSLVSRPLPELIDKIQAALASGHTRIHLLADDVGCWGQDLGLSSAHLLSAIFQIPGNFKVIINYFDPTWLVRLYPELRKPLADPRLICLNVPIQSGNDQMLQAMDRHYKINDVIKILGEVKSANSSLAIKTHLMIGYPGESSAQFWDSMRTLPYFDMVYANKYGPRPGTPAEKLTQLPEWTKHWRFFALKLGANFVHFTTLFKTFFRRSPLGTA